MNVIMPPDEGKRRIGSRVVEKVKLPHLVRTWREHGTGVRRKGTCCVWVLVGYDSFWGICVCAAPRTRVGLDVDVVVST